MKHLKFLSLFGMLFIASCSAYNSLSGYNYYTEEPGVKTKYDKFEQSWSYETSENAVLRKNVLNVNSSASIYCKKKEDCQGKPVSIIFNSTSSFWAFLDYHKLTFLVDDKRFVYAPHHSGYVVSGNRVNETLTATLKWDDFEEIARSKNVSAELGAYEIDLSYGNREIYRKLLQLVIHER